MNNESCPCCGLTGTTHLFQRRLDVSGDSVEICICSACTVITNRTNLLKEKTDSVEALHVQINSADWFYVSAIFDAPRRPLQG